MSSVQEVHTDTSSGYSSDEECTYAGKGNDSISSFFSSVDFNNFPRLTPEEWTADKVRQAFIEYFKSENHVYYESSAVVPHNDPSLLFINAGMNQFKPLILGNVELGSPLYGLKRAANSQKCIRAGGKHNDLEDVGMDVYHHTFFEMLGNWSFGDYFKEKAIHCAWSLLTEVFHLSKDRLYVTYFGGDDKTAADIEAREIWKKYLPANRILPFDSKDNFWEMADTGPCGPCSEIHYDRIGNRDASSLVNMDDPSVLEIWNIVFMQFNRENDKSLTPLPSPCVDTGMGLERLVSILQNRQSNYDTDLFQPIFDAIHKSINNLPRYSAKVGKEDVNGIDTAYRIIADHIRCLTIAISDGAEPSNEGRGYVLRRILRRAVRYAMQKLNAPSNEGWLYKLVDVVVTTLGPIYPHIYARKKMIRKIIKREELQFAKTLNKGVDKFNKIVRRMKEKNEGNIISGNDAFLLYATFGFPVDLTKLMAYEIDFNVDEVNYEIKVLEHQKKSESMKFKGSENILSNLTADKMYCLQNDDEIVPTNDIYKYDWNTEGTGNIFHSKLIAIWDGEFFIDEITANKNNVGKQYALIFDRTNFYSEQGGQVTDEGKIVKITNEKDTKQEKEDVYDFSKLKDELKVICNEQKKIESIFNVCDVNKLGGFVFHAGFLLSGNFKVNESYAMAVNFKRRALIAKNHSATHLLNFALRKILGAECNQKGSLVDDYKLRFDFSWQKAVDLKELFEVENIVQNIINKKEPVYTSEVSYAQARKINGIRAVFGEVYPDPCRVVSVGCDVNTLIEDKQNNNTNACVDTSVELCGGTHVKNTAEIHKISIVAEEGIAKGIRRVTALTGEEAVKSEKCSQNFVKVIGELANKVDVFISRLNHLDNKIEKNDEEIGKGSVECDELFKEVQTVKQHLNNAKNISLNTKKDLNKNIEESFKKLLAEQKRQSKILIANAIILGTQLAKENKNKKFVIHDFGKTLAGDLKAIEAAFHSFAELSPGVCTFLLTSNSISRNVAAVAFVSNEMIQNKMSAKEWLENCLKELDGKGGGKDDKAIGCMKECAKFDLLDNAIVAAKRYASKFFKD